MNNANRIEWIDYMKAFSIMAVVLYHTHIMPEIKTISYLVCLPAFFLCAGMFTNTSLTPKEFFLKKTLRLLIPYLVFGVLTWIFWVFIGRHYGHDTDASRPWWFPLMGLAIGKVDYLIQDSPLWFLCCLVSLEWIYYGVSRIRRIGVRWLIIISLAALGCILSYFQQNWIWGITSAMIMLPIYALGAEKSTRIKDLSVSLKSGWLVVLLLSSLIGLLLGYLYNPKINISDNEVYNPLLFYLTVLSTIGLWYAVANLLYRHCCRFRGLLYIGSNTLIILCIHTLFFSIVKGIGLIVHVPLSFYETTIGSLTLWAASLILMIPVIYIVNRFLPFMIGKPYRSNKSTLD